MDKTNKILIIEDSHLLRLKIKQELMGLGFSNIAEFSSAKTIIDRPNLYLNDVSLIILDIGLPEISGLDFAKKLKEHPQYCNIPIIFITGHNEYKTVQAAIELGGIDYILKPLRDNFAERFKKVIQALFGTAEERNEDDISRIEQVITNEYERSNRAGQPLSFLLFRGEKGVLEEAGSVIRKTLRKIDSVLTAEDMILVVLPLTGEKNLNVVIDKIKNQLQQNKFDLALEKTVSFEPESKKSMDDIKNELFQK